MRKLSCQVNPNVQDLPRMKLWLSGICREACFTKTNFKWEFISELFKKSSFPAQKNVLFSQFLYVNWPVFPCVPGERSKTGQVRESLGSFVTSQAQRAV